MQESHGLAGHLTVTLRDAAGQVVAERRVQNLITSAGRTLLARLLTGEAQMDVSRMAIAIGTGTAAPSLADTELGARVAAAAASAATPVPDGKQMKVKVSATFPGADLTGTQTVTEAGIELTPAGGVVLYNRVVFPPISRTPNLDMTLSWEVLF